MSGERGGANIIATECPVKKGDWRHGVRVEIITIFVLPDDDDEGINEEGHN